MPPSPEGWNLHRYKASSNRTKRKMSPRPFLRLSRTKTAIDIQTLARRHGPEAIETLAQALKSRNERVRVAAASILLDRAYGKAMQPIAADPATSAIGMHLLAAGLVSREIVATLEQREQHTISPTEPSNNQADGKIVDILLLPPPEE